MYYKTCCINTTFSLQKDCLDWVCVRAHVCQGGWEISEEGWGIAGQGSEVTEWLPSVLAWPFRRGGIERGGEASRVGFPRGKNGLRKSQKVRSLQQRAGWGARVQLCVSSWRSLPPSFFRVPKTSAGSVPASELPLWNWRAPFLPNLQTGKKWVKESRLQERQRT